MTVGITELPPEGMLLPGVALAGDTERGTKTTEGISLLFSSAGITVQGPQPQIERLLVWTALDSATCREVVQLPDGREAAIMELTSGGQSIRFLLPTDSVSPGQAAYLDQALPTWLARYKGSAVPAAPDHGCSRRHRRQPCVRAGEPEMGVTLPAPGPTTGPRPSVEPRTPRRLAPIFATAGSPGCAGDRRLAAAGLAPERRSTLRANGHGAIRNSVPSRRDAPARGPDMPAPPAPSCAPPAPRRRPARGPTMPAPVMPAPPAPTMKPRRLPAMPAPAMQAPPAPTSQPPPPPRPAGTSSTRVQLRHGPDRCRTRHARHRPLPVRRTHHEAPPPPPPAPAAPACQRPSSSSAPSTSRRRPDRRLAPVMRPQHLRRLATA